MKLNYRHTKTNTKETTTYDLEFSKLRDVV